MQGRDPNRGKQRRRGTGPILGTMRPPAHHAGGLSLHRGYTWKWCGRCVPIRADFMPILLKHILPKTRNTAPPKKKTHSRRGTALCYGCSLLTPKFAPQNLPVTAYAGLPPVPHRNPSTFRPPPPDGAHSQNLCCRGEDWYWLRAIHYRVSRVAQRVKTQVREDEQTAMERL